MEGVRFLRSWGNFVPVLIDFGPFEILLAIKLTVCCATSTDLSFLLLLKQTGRAPQCPNNPTPKFIFPSTDASNYTGRTGVIVKLRPPWNK